MNAPKPVISVGAVVQHDGQLLLVQRGQEPETGRWSLPGGHVEFGEPLWEAVVREVLEETGLDVAVDGLAGWVERIDPSGTHHFVILDFFATPLDPDPVPVAGDDAAAVRWVPLEDVSEAGLVDGLAEFLVDAGVIADTRPFHIEIHRP